MLCRSAFCRLVLAISMVVYGGSSARAIQTEDVNLQYNGSSDDLVHIRRNSTGQITIQDADHVIPVPLSDLVASSSPGRVVTLGPAGCDTTTFPAAIAAAAAMTPTDGSRVTILVYGGVYTVTQRETLPRYVNLVGIGHVVIQGNANQRPTDEPPGTGWYDGEDATSSALVTTEGDNKIEGIVFENLRTVYPSVAVYANAGSGEKVVLFHCRFVGGKEDPLYLAGAGSIKVDLCEVESTGGGDSLSIAVPAGSTYRISRSWIKAGGNGNPAIWFTGGGTAVFSECDFEVPSTSYGTIRLQNTAGAGGAVFFSYCTMKNADRSAGKVLQAVESGTGWTMALDRCVFSSPGTIPGSLTVTQDVFGGNAQIYGAATVSGTTTTYGEFHAHGTSAVFGLADDSDGVPANVSFVGRNTGTETVAVGLQILGELVGDGRVSLVFGGDTNLDRSAANVLSCNGYFDGVSGLMTSGAERISSTGEGKFVGLNTTVTQWEYFDALSCANGDRAAVSGADAWIPDTAPGASCLTSATDEVCLYFRISYQTGTVVTRLSVRSQGIGASDGVKFTFQRRQGGTASAAWTTIDSTQSYVSATEANNVFNCTDTTLASGYEYRAVVEAEAVATGSRVWGIGVETSRRAY